jgi:hypothetical protein
VSPVIRCRWWLGKEEWPDCQSTKLYGCYHEDIFVFSISLDVAFESFSSLLGSNLGVGLELKVVNKQFFAVV